MNTKTSTTNARGEHSSDIALKVHPPKTNQIEGISSTPKLPNGESFGINEMVITDHFKAKTLKPLYIFAVTAKLTSGKGYITIKDFIKEVSEYCNISTRTADRWIGVLMRHKLVRIKKGMIRPKGRKLLETNHQPTRWYIKFFDDHLKSYSAFRYHCIQQIALLLQKRFRYAWKDLKNNESEFLQSTGQIETDLAMIKSRKQVGCSISKIQEKLGLSKSEISVALKGVTEKQFNYTLPIKGKVARVKYAEILKHAASKRPHEYLSNRWGFKYDQKNDTYQISYALASVITAPSYLSKRKNHKA